MTTIKAPKLDMTKVIKRFAVQSDLYFARRTSGGTWLNGRWEEVDAITASITGNVQPLGGDEAQNLDESTRTRGGIVVYGLSEIVPSGRTPSDIGDVIVWKGVNYEVLNVEAWDTIGSYWRAVAVKADQ